MKAGDEIEVIVQNPTSEQLNRVGNPLYEIIGIAGNGGKVDGAENHDKYLYGKKTP